jgi:CubicO group peptidase (beta-lactamase class C family)
MRDGVVAAAKVITEREAPQGTRCSYASAETEILAGVLQGATGMNLSEYLNAPVAGDRCRDFSAVARRQAGPGTRRG